jgi:AcrR family transcriptional regulator
MARKRSRIDTEQRFQDAVLELLAESGCSNLGVNLVAQRAGSDKVLIYRYFGGLDGLLERVAESRSWLPTADELLSALSGEPARLVHELARRISHHIRKDAATHKLALWRHVVQNPLTERYTAEWKSLWRELTESLGHGLDYDARNKWSKACALLALTIQAELADEAVEKGSLDPLIEQLDQPSSGAEAESSEDDEDSLPTNLL